MHGQVTIGIQLGVSAEECQGWFTRGRSVSERQRAIPTMHHGQGRRLEWTIFNRPSADSYTWSQSDHITLLS